MPGTAPGTALPRTAIEIAFSVEGGSIEEQDSLLADLSEFLKRKSTSSMNISGPEKIVSGLGRANSLSKEEQEELAADYHFVMNCRIAPNDDEDE